MSLILEQQQQTMLDSLKAQLVTANDPFEFTSEDVEEFRGLKAVARVALARGFHIFGLTPKDKIPLLGSNGFKDSKAPSDPTALVPWEQDSNRNIGIDLGASDLCVLDFDDDRSIPAWVDGIKTFKVKSSRGIHIYFRGARPTTKLYVDNMKVGDVKSEGGYVLAAGSIHPDGPVYTVIDDSPIVPLPDISALIRHESERVNVSPDGPMIPHGLHDIELTRIAGVLRGAGMSPQKIEEHLIETCESRCEGHGSDYKQMCSKIAHSIGKKPVQPLTTVLLGGVPASQSTISVAQTSTPTDWRANFKSIGELEKGDVQMLIAGFLPEGTTFVGGLPGEGKTLFALSIARALTTGKPFLNTFGVKQTVPVIYLIPESGGRAFRKRCETFQIPNDPDLFLCRTVSEGSTLPLDDASLLEAIRSLRPVVILDTIIRFSSASDENAAAQNKKLVDDVIRLRQAGAIAVIGLHHATKAMRKDGMSLETALRGTGDIAAAADAVYGLLRDDMLYNHGAGPNEIDVACLKPRDFDPPQPFRIAATARPNSPQAGIVVGMDSVVDHNHDFVLVSRGTQMKDIEGRIEQLVIDAPTITIKGLAEKTGRTDWEVRKTIQKLGYQRSRGGAKGGVTGWTKASMSTIKVRSEAEKDEVGREPEVDFDKAA